MVTTYRLPCTQLALKGSRQSTGAGQLNQHGGPIMVVFPTQGSHCAHVDAIEASTVVESSCLGSDRGPVEWSWSLHWCSCISYQFVSVQFKVTTFEALWSLRCLLPSSELPVLWGSAAPSPTVILSTLAENLHCNSLSHHHCEQCSVLVLPVFIIFEGLFWFCCWFCNWFCCLYCLFYLNTFIEKIFPFTFPSDGSDRDP